MSIKIAGVGSNTVTCLRDVITEGLVALRYTVVKQRKGADLCERESEELVDPVAVYPWRRADGACLLLFCGMCHRKLQPVIGKCVPFFAKQSPRKN